MPPRTKQIADYHIINPADLNGYKGPNNNLLFKNGRGVTYDPTSTEIIDNLFVFGAAGKGGGRFIRKNKILDAREDFGAVGDGVADDGPALQEWISATGGVHYLPAGTYRSSISLIRYRKGRTTIYGDGSGMSKIHFSNDTNGVRIENQDEAYNGIYGGIRLIGFSVISTGTKTTDKMALFVKSVDVYRPGPTLFDITTDAKLRPDVINVNFDWQTSIHLLDCSQSNLNSINISGNSTEVQYGITLTNTANLRVVEHNWTNIGIYNVKRAINIASNGVPAVEGVNLTNFNFVNVKQGVRAETPGYGAPSINLSNGHIDAHGGECFYSDNYKQLCFSNVLFYCRNDGGTSPDQAVYIGNCDNAKGYFLVNTLDNIATAVKFGGNGGLIDLDITHTCESAKTRTVFVSTGYVGGGALLGLVRTWSSNATWGSEQGQNIIPSGIRVKISLLWEDVSPANGSLLQFSTQTYTYKAVSKSVAGKSDQLVLDRAGLIDLRTCNTILLFGGNYTLTIDWSKVSGNERFRILRADANAGPITLQTSDPANNKIVNPDGSYLNSYTLPTTPGQRNAEFECTAANCYFFK